MESQQRALARTAANPEPTPSPDRNPSSERTSPQENVEMNLPGSYPSSSTGPRNLSGLVSPPVQSPAQTPEQNHAHLAVQNAMNASNYVGQNLTNVAANHAPYTNQMAMNMPAQNTLNYPAYTAQNAMKRSESEFRAELRGAVAAKPTTNLFRAPQTPQLQQGLPATSQQGGLPPTVARIAVRISVPEGIGFITTATTHQYTSLHISNSAPPLTLFNTNQVETWGDPGGEGGFPNRRTTPPRSWRWEPST
ncbi:hypothetical protein H4Q26_003763 [Puccinia striiformis f. sp. tritici PST-130]|nr:hypothetical protein H4Q26_003763 [Puccinia striiformis f. sp. tritici PST-130]